MKVQYGDPVTEQEKFYRTDGIFSIMLVPYLNIVWHLYPIETGIVHREGGMLPSQHMGTNVGW